MKGGRFPMTLRLYMTENPMTVQASGLSCTKIIIKRRKKKPL